MILTIVFYCEIRFCTKVVKNKEKIRYCLKNVHPSLKKIIFVYRKALIRTQAHKFKRFFLYTKTGFKHLFKGFQFTDINLQNTELFNIFCKYMNLYSKYL